MRLCDNKASSDRQPERWARVLVLPLLVAFMTLAAWVLYPRGVSTAVSITDRKPTIGDEHDRIAKVGTNAIENGDPLPINISVALAGAVCSKIADAAPKEKYLHAVPAVINLLVPPLPALSGI